MLIMMGIGQCIAISVPVQQPKILAEDFDGAGYYKILKAQRLIEAISSCVAPEQMV
jgi:hypothetical protein